MIKILYYGMGYNAGGIERYLLRVIRNLDMNKFCVGVINEQGENLCYKKELELLGVEFYPVIQRRKNPIKNYIQIKKLFKENKFDIFHCNINTLSYANPIFEAIRNNCKVIVHSRNAGNNESVVTRMLHKINFIRLKNKDVKRIAVSKKAGDWLFGEGSQFTVVHNGIDIEKNTFSEAARASIRKELKIEGKTVIGHVGIFLPTKNQKFVIEILDEIIKHKLIKNVVLLFVGDGPERYEIESLVVKKGLQNYVKFVGIRNDVAEIMSAMDYLVFPSLYEGFPNVILEAQTNGLSCLISDVITEEVIITDLVKKKALNNTAEEWAKEIPFLKTADNRKDYAFNVAQLGFSAEKEKEKVEHLYSSLTKEIYER